MTATALFQPTRPDGRAYWEVVADYLDDRYDLASIDGDDVVIVSHGDLLRALDLPDAELPTVYRTMTRVGKWLRSTHQRSLISVRGVGYQIIAGPKQTRQGQNQHRRTERSAKKALEIFRSTDTALMNPTQVAYHTALQLGMEALVQHGKDIKMLKEQRIEDKKTVHQTRDDVAALRAELDRLKQHLDNVD